MSDVSREYTFDLDGSPLTLMCHGSGGTVGLLYTGGDPSFSIENLLDGFGPPQESFLVPRSGKWSAVRRHHLDKFPTCAACGGTQNVQVHHIKPFHLHPELELEESNFITLCQKPSLSHHFNLGHSGKWEDVNPYVVEDAALMLKRFRERIHG